MAEDMGLSQASYSRLEAGKSAFSIDQMYQAAIALNVPMSDIIGDIEKYTAKLKARGIAVEPQIGGNTTQATKTKQVDDTGKVLAGAALGALVMALLSGR
jgi:transcriptional regulator with XRE-family HTH domain